MNWKKILGNAVLAPFAVVLGAWGQATVTGQHVAFTAGNILIPAIPVVLTQLLALFQTPPHADSPLTGGK
jgi:hypothetical protein